MVGRGCRLVLGPVLIGGFGADGIISFGGAFSVAITFDDRPLMDHNVVVEAGVVGVVVDIRL